MCFGSVLCIPSLPECINFLLFVYEQHLFALLCYCLYVAAALRSLQLITVPPCMSTISVNCLLVFQAVFVYQYSRNGFFVGLNRTQRFFVFFSSKTTHSLPSHNGMMINTAVLAASSVALLPLATKQLTCTHLWLCNAVVRYIDFRAKAKIL